MSLRVAIAQIAPAHLDVAGSLDLAVGAIERAADEGARLVAFGEVWLTGYPGWLDHARNAALWADRAMKDAYAALVENAVEIPGPAFERLADVARRREVVVVMGAHERVRAGAGNGSLYAASVVIDADGAILNHHRKLVPTFNERLIWAPGDGAGLRAVETRSGRVGVLLCWEHWMPAVRQALHLGGEVVHVAQWPEVSEAHQLASRHYAFEGRCFVLAAGSIERWSATPPGLDLGEARARSPSELRLRGGSAIIAPDASYVVAPVMDEERLVIGDIDPRDVAREKMTLDVTGHYDRPDVARVVLGEGVGRGRGRT